MSDVPTLQRSFQQQPLAQFEALQSAEPLLLEVLLDELLALLLDEPFEPLLLDELLALLLELPKPDVDEVELLELASPFPPDPAVPLPLPPPETLSKSSPVAHATMTKHETKYQ